MSSTPHTVFFRILRTFLRLVFAVGASLLVLLLVAQLVLLLQGSWRVPAPLLSRLHKDLAEQGLKIQYERIGFRPPAQLTVRRLEAMQADDDEPWLSAEAGRIDLSLSQLLQGNLEIEEISLYGGAVFCPSSLSPTGVRETILKRTHATVIRSNEEWRLPNLNGTLQNLNITALGTFPRLPERVGEPIGWEDALKDALPAIVRARDTFQRAKEPRVHLQFAPSPDEGVVVAAEFRAEEIDAPENLRILRPHAATKWIYDGKHWKEEATSVEALAVNWNSQATAHRIRGELRWKPAQDGEPPIPEHGDLVIAELETEAGSLFDFRAKIAVENMDDLATEVFALFQNEPIEGTARINWRTGMGELTGLSRINPTPVLQHPRAREFGLNRDLFFHESPFARATARVEGWRITEAAGRAFVRQADIDGVFMDHASARAELRPNGTFFVSELILTYKDFQVSGSYETDLSTKAYRFLFKGSVRPLHISEWFEDWWTTLWQEFEFPHAPLQGDVDIYGVLGHTEEVKLTGTVRGEDFFLRGVHFGELNASLFALDGFFDMFDIDLRREEGTAAGSFQYWMDPVTREFATIKFQSNSTVDPTEMGRIFGEAGSDIVSPFRFTEPPSLSMKGTVHGPLREEKNRVQLAGKTKAPLHYHGLALDWLSVEILVDGDEWDLEQLDAGLAGGEATGSIRKWPADDEEHLDLSMLMLNLDLRRTLDIITGWRTEAGMQELKAAGANTVTGLIDMHLEATGTFGDFQSFSGDGGIQITDADLAEVHLLGILSRLLSATPLGFTSLSFNEADTRFQLEREKIVFPDLRLVGPSSQIRADGHYRLDTEELDFSVQLHLLRESRIPFLHLLLSPVLQPLAHAMEIRLTGTPADPQWRFLLGPRNILSEISAGGESRKASGQKE